MNIEWCKSCDKGLPAPDVIIFLDINVDTASLRGQYGEERYEKIDFQRLVRDEFLRLKTEDESSSSGSGVLWYVIDATKSIDIIQREIQVIADETIARVKHTPINTLWNTEK